MTNKQIFNASRTCIENGNGGKLPRVLWVMRIIMEMVSNEGRKYFIVIALGWSSSRENMSWFGKYIRTYRGIMMWPLYLVMCWLLAVVVRDYHKPRRSYWFHDDLLINLVRQSLGTIVRPSSNDKGGEHRKR